MMSLTKIINSSFILIEKINIYGILKKIIIKYNKKTNIIGKRRNTVQGLSKDKGNINSLLNNKNKKESSIKIKIII